MTYFYKAVEPPGEARKLVVSHKGLAAILWENDDPKRVRLGELLKAVDHPILERAEDQLSHFFARTWRSFDIEPRPRRHRIPEERLGSTANDSLRPDTLIREDRKCRWRSEGGPRRRCGKTARSPIVVNMLAVQSRIALLRQMRGGYQKRMQQAPSRPPVTCIGPNVITCVALALNGWLRMAS